MFGSWARWRSGAGRPLPLGGTKQRAVLAMLALHTNQVVSIDYLVDGLWGGSCLTAPPRVQVYISRLRKLLHASRGRLAAFVLVRRRPGYLLEVDADELDLARFERLAHQGTQALRPAPRLAAAKLREALELWRGPPLAEFTDEPFAQAESARLEEQRLTACRRGSRPIWPSGGTPSWSGSWRRWSRGSRCGGAAPAAHGQPVPLGSAGRGAGGLPAGPRRLLRSWASTQAGHCRNSKPRSWPRMGVWTGLHRLMSRPQRSASRPRGAWSGRHRQQCGRRSGRPAHRRPAADGVAGAAAESAVHRPRRHARRAAAAAARR